jgi:hypothetical protein
MVVRALQPTYVFALLGAGALAYLLPSSATYLAGMNRLAAQQQMHLDDYALVEQELAKSRHNQASARDILSLAANH